MKRLIRLLTLAVLGLTLAGSLLAAPQRFTPSVAMSQVVSKVPIVAPPMARQLKLSGTVDIEVTIDEAGNVESAEVVKGNPILGRAAADTLKKWKFKPFKKDDQVVKAIVTIACEYK